MILRFALATLSGALYFLGFVGFDQWYLAWFCLVPIFFALENATAKQGFFLGWLMGAVLMTGGFYWVAYTIHQFAYMPWAVAALGCLLLCIAQGVEFAVFGFVYALLRRRTRFSPLLLAPAVFVSAEFLSPQLFPHYFANSQYKMIPLIQICDVTGVSGLSAFLVFVNACIYGLFSCGCHSEPKAKNLVNFTGFFASLRMTNWTSATAALFAIAAVLAYGFFRVPHVEKAMQNSPHLRFGVTQPNLGIREKSRNPQKALRTSREQTFALKGKGADIVVWPETAVHEPAIDSEAKTLPREISGGLDVPILFGAIQTGNEPGSELFNVAVLADKDGTILGEYKKQKLLMFGETIPFGKTFPILYDWFPYISNFDRGDSNAPLKFGDYRLSVNICYEEILPRLIRKMAAYSPHVFINITNDNWFGRTHEPMQHLVLAAFRSVEHRRWLVRSTNTGISAFVDATGKILDKSPLMEATAPIRDVPMMEGKTIYTIFGDWFSWMCVGLTLCICLRKPSRL